MMTRPRLKASAVWPFSKKIVNYTKHLNNENDRHMLVVDGGHVDIWGLFDHQFKLKLANKSGLRLKRLIQIEIEYKSGCMPMH